MKSRHPMRGFWRLLAALPLLVGSGRVSAEPTADGLYAGFTTSEGSFWCRLEFERAPRTVANFVSLAEGTRPWVDFAKARIVQRPFYDGLTFHRVVSNFVNQAGSPNSRGTDGPGYTFRDEFHAQLRHSKAGILSMANSGPHSNGSQFFVTLGPTPWLDDRHSVFGEVVEGLEVVQRINRVRTINDVPVTPVVIQQVRVVRLGAAAQAFDPTTVAPGLPNVAPAQSDLDFEPGRLRLSISVETNRVYHVFFGPDLRAWSSQSFSTSPIDATALLGQPQMFFLVLSGGFER